MVKCKSIKPNALKICANNLKYVIEIQTNEITSSNYIDVDVDAKYITIASAPAMIKTLGVNTQRMNGAFIDGSNINNTPTTQFYTRYLANVDTTVQLWIILGNNRYRVLASDDIDKARTTMVFNTVCVGKANIVSNR